MKKPLFPRDKGIFLFPSEAIRFPILQVTQELYDDESFAELMPWWYVKVNYDFNIDVFWFAVYPIAPFVALYFWWMRHRWIVERILRNRIFDAQPFDHCRNWKLRPRSRWSWKKTRTPKSVFHNETSLEQLPATPENLMKIHERNK